MIDDSSMRIAITNVKAEKGEVAAVDKTSNMGSWEASNPRLFIDSHTIGFPGEFL